MQTAIDLGAPPPDQDLDWGDLTAGELLRRIRNTSRTEAEKGQWFENLFAQLARNEPEFELEEVWRWAQWPDRKRLTGLSGQDIGVDLVARHQDGTLIAIQCKCYASHHRVTKADVQSFLAGSQQEIFGLRWIVTTSRWGRTAENLIQDTNIRRIDFRSYQDRRITAKEVKRPVRQPWPLQEEAIESVLQGLKHHNRGRLIMACGTGKTFTALRIAERIVPAGEAILFLAPTIALVSQARREWLTHTTRPLSSLVVCSDPYAGGRNEQEDISISELECPVVSNPEEIAAKLMSAPHTKVVFCTYQSLLRITEAQERYGVEPFALAVADEAHRTTGVLNRPREKVDFQLVHDGERLLARKRLYMTATPRIYTEKSKSRLAKREVEVVDMSDETTYGPQFHRLRFKTAVDDGKLSDYRVIVLGVDQSRVTPGLRTRLEGLAEGDRKSQPTMNDITRVLGVSLAINGLSEGKGIERPDRLPRTMAYANSIKRSKWFAAALMDPFVKGATTRRLRGEDRAWSVEAEHLDASASALDRSQALRRLSSAGKDGTLRVLCNVKLFTEGVDVPSLNAVAFLDPRDSQVDVVQAVGRVMRRAEDKNFGYIVVPVVVQPGMDVADALRNSREGYHTLGKVLRALQAHDERLHEDIARFVQVYEPKPDPNAPGDPRDDPPGLFDDLELEPADEGIFAHVAAASGLGQPGKLVADEIAWAVQRAAEIFQNEEVEEPLADALDLPADNEQARKAARTIAALLLCNACLMHRRLRDVRDMRMLPGLGRVGATDDPSSVLKASWSTILEFDYKPVFEPALAALNALPTNEGIRSALRGLSECADNLADSLNDLGYDHAGPLYHRILGSAKSDGAFYTNNVSALLLARLALDETFVDWSDPQAVEKLRIIDPACGTGTLLMAALRTIKARMREVGALGEGSDEQLHRTLVQEVLCGLDINRHGVQLAACNLTLGAPSVDYARMNLHTMQHGPQDEETVRAGSLEILRQREDGLQPTLFQMASKLQGTDALGTPWEADEAGSDFPLNDVDLVIMNPPFTRNTKRGEKFTGDAKKRMQERELRIRDELMKRDQQAGDVINANSIRTSFTPLADQLLQYERGVIAEVLPATACIGASGELERRFLAERFHIERIVTSHDPKRINFSENTGIHESLLICRRRNGSTEAAPTEFVSLRRMPASAKEAIEAADAIAAGSEAWASRTFWPEKRMRAGDWTPVQWYDGSLAHAAREIEDSPGLEPLGARHAVGPAGRRVQDAFRRCEASAEGAVPGFHSVSSKIRQTMRGTNDVWYQPRPGKEPLAERYLEQRSHLLLPFRFRTTNGRLTAVWTPAPSFGYWVPVEVEDEHTATALAAWCNSTPVRLMLLNRRARALTYPVWVLEHLREIRIPKPDSPAWDGLAAAYTQACELELRPMRQAEECMVRRVIDRAAAMALDADEAQFAEWRRKLSREPTVSNEPANRTGDDV
ncbi:MAG: DEAD/DEAH box helicase family protein [Acidobacteriota bacterium]|nr:DEAD/DEAH box helicase family protein [Acidobacteriota bacterium]MDE3264084.1 DEAD/DEAH box helicase family protein [Acidobacteriota bacterium]